MNMMSRNMTTKFLLAAFAILSLFLMSALCLPTPVSDESTSSQLSKRGVPSGSKLISDKSKLTYYWVAFESLHKSGPTVTIKTCRGKPLATVLRSFAVEMKTEGTGVAKNGRVFNFGDCDCGRGFSCFDELDKRRFPFGIAANGKPLQPYATVAVNDIRLGTKLYLPQLDGLKLPSGETHNGCVIADDNGHGLGRRHIDWFVAKETNYDILDRKNINNVKVLNAANCKILKYKP